MTEERSTVRPMVVAFLAGGIIGAGLALLFAPVSGAEARRRLGEITGDVKRKAEELTADLRKKAEAVIDIERKRAKAGTESFKDIVEGPN